MIVEEDKLHQVLRKLEQASGRYRKKTNDTKVFATPLCPDLKSRPRPTLKLGGKILEYKTDEKILGFTLSKTIQGSQNYLPRYKAKAETAVAKLEKIGASSGPEVKPEITAKYYNTLVLPVMTANLTLPQLKSKGSKPHGYVAARPPDRRSRMDTTRRRNHQTQAEADEQEHQQIAGL